MSLNVINPELFLGFPQALSRWKQRYSHKFSFCKCSTSVKELHLVDCHDHGIQTSPFFESIKTGQHQPDPFQSSQSGECLFPTGCSSPYASLCVGILKCLPPPNVSISTTRIRPSPPRPTLLQVRGSWFLEGGVGGTPALIIFNSMGVSKRENIKLSEDGSLK